MPAQKNQKMHKNWLFECESVKFPKNSLLCIIFFFYGHFDTMPAQRILRLESLTVTSCPAALTEDVAGGTSEKIGEEEDDV